MRLRSKARLDVLSGFLGSGKTTLLRHHLAAIPDPDRVAVVINEFGATGIDHRLVRASGDAPQVLADGCACCIVAERLRATLLDLMREDAASGGHRISRIILETSGLADPASILATVQSDEVLAEYLEIGTCAIAFDALDGLELTERFPEVRNQLAAADAVVISKADIAPAGSVEAAIRAVHTLNPLAIARVSGMADFEPASLFDAPANRRSPPRGPTGNRHAGGIASFCLRRNDPIDWASFSVWLTALLNRHGARILRFKAVLATEGHRLPLVVHGVRHRVYPPQHLPESEEVPGQSDLVFIVDGLEPAAIEASLDRFLQFAARHLEQETARDRAAVSAPQRPFEVNPS